MNEQRKLFWLIISMLVILAFFLLFRRERQTNSGTITTNESAEERANSAEEKRIQTEPSRPPAAVNEQANVMQEMRDRKEQMRRDSEREVAMWQSPILYFGKVVDESNQPISGVEVSYRASALNEARSEVENSGKATSDSRGIFKIDGVKGIGLMLDLSHPNYYPYPENSTGFDKRSLPRKRYFSDSEENAELFRMHSKGTPVPLIFRGGGFHAPNDGSIANFPLRGRTRAEILGQLQIQGWNSVRAETNPYDWKIQLTLPSGGLIESTNYFGFVAPQTGYSESLNFQISGGEMTRKQFFLKLPSGYIRFKLQVIMGKDMFVSGDYYYNPDGSRNLEPSEEIRLTQ
jgi:protocatechuate 3,4-dioxygenase beta subunit